MSCVCLDGNKCEYSDDICKFLLMIPKQVPDENKCASIFNRGPYTTNIK